MLLFPATSSTAVTLLETFSPSAGTNSGGWLNYTIREVYDNSLFTNSGTAIKVTFISSTAEALNITAAYVGLGSTGGDVYDYEAAPTQLLFSGSGSVNIAANSTAQSDLITFSYDTAKDLIIAAHVENNSAADAIRQSSGLGANYDGCYKSGGDDTTTVLATGYTVNNGVNYAVSSVEIWG